MAENEQIIEDPFAKKPQYVGAALKSINWGVMAGGAALGLFFMGGNIPLGMAVTSGINAAVSVKQEHDETQGQRITVVDQPKNKDVNFFGSGLVVGGLVAAALPLSISVLPVAVATGVGMHFVGEALKSQEEKDLRAAQIQVSNDQVNNAYNAAYIDNNVTTDIDDRPILGKHTASSRVRSSKKITPQDIIAQQEQANQPQLMGVG